MPRPRPSQHALVLSFLAACTVEELPTGDDAGTTTAFSTTDDATTIDATTDDTTTASETSAGTTSTNDFVIETDFPAPDCDSFAQNCPEGEKCVPYSNDGSPIWNANKCVPIMGTGQPGDACIWDGIVEATDDCGAGSICWDVMDVDGVYAGTCNALCANTPDDPVCPESSYCAIGGRGVIAVCIPLCNPLLQDCKPGQGCFWAVGAFECIFTAGELPTSDPCGYINDCAPGNVCIDAIYLPSCDGSACCASFCSLADPVCPIMGTECVAFFEMGMAPPGYEDIGVCILPP